MELIANKSVVELELRNALRSRRAVPHNRVLLLRAAPEWRDPSVFSADLGSGPVPVTVAKCPTVLSVLDALASFGQGDPGQDSRSRGDGYLVVLTPCDARDVGESVLSRALRTEIKPVDRWDLVRETFGARHLDPVLTKEKYQWVAEALLDAQPEGSGRKLTGLVLTQAAALNRLASLRLGIGVTDDSPVDAAALLEWTLDPARVARFSALRDEERGPLADWLRESTGPVADVVFRLVALGRVADAVPFGLVAGALYGGTSTDDADSTIARVRAEERYLGGQTPGEDTLRRFGRAAESLVTRWTEADNGHASDAAGLCEQAEAIIDELSTNEEDRRSLAGRSMVLEAGMAARVAVFADALADALAMSVRPVSAGSAGPAQPDPLATAVAALARAERHGRKREHGADLRAARSALRLARWLSVPEEAPETLAAAATRMLRSWGWADRALTAIERADTSRVPRLGEVYQDLWQRARERRAVLDDAFASKLAAWTESGGPTDLVCVENLLDRIARPVAAKMAPVIVVVDGMTVAAATELAGEVTSRGQWQEAGRLADGREPVLATVPSITAVSRTSLLTGTLAQGGQAEERAGFAKFWGRQRAVLFHKGDLTPEPGTSLAAEVRAAIADSSTVVGIVLNTIDDALDKGQQGGPANWTLASVTYLRALLDEARRAGRPIILTADHGHVLDHGAEINSAQSDAARYRSGVASAGTADSGEILIRGPRVLTDGNAVIAAVDENIHYTSRKAGYHGGASPAEVVIPVITLFPPGASLPSGWTPYDAVGHAPAWWSTAPATVQSAAAKSASPSAAPSHRKRPKPPSEAPGDALFGIGDMPDQERQSSAPGTLGARVAGSERLAVQRKFVRHAPASESVAALIDALVANANRLTTAEAAEIVGIAPVRMSGYLPHVMRLLNLDGYQVLQTIDGGRMVELNPALLEQQFLRP